jgi:hypothetical protein
MNEEMKIYVCKSCGKNSNEVKFYSNLTSKCSECKKKISKEYRESKKEDKIDEIDPDEKIRYLWSQMMEKPFYRNGKKSILDFMREAENDISDLVLLTENLKDEIADLKEENENLKNKLEKYSYFLQKNTETISKFENEIQNHFEIKNSK